MAHGRMSGERTRQLDYATIGKTEVALKYGCRSASERWEGLRTLAATRRRNNVGKSIKGVEIKKRDGNTLNGGTQQV